MVDNVVRLSGADLSERLRRADPRTADDVSLTRDGRRLDSKHAVLAWLEEIGPTLERLRALQEDDSRDWLAELDRELTTGRHGGNSVPDI